MEVLGAIAFKFTFCVVIPLWITEVLFETRKDEANSVCL